jgi:hypothetical protein
MTHLIADEHRRELRDAARRYRWSRADSGARRQTGEITIRYARTTDAESLALLAELDSAAAPGVAALVAEVDGRPRAALPLDGSGPIADPFYRTAELIELLRIRARQLAGGMYATPGR